MILVNSVYRSSMGRTLSHRIIFNKVTFKNFSSKEASSQNHYDIIIAGGGMVGTTLACRLGRNSVLADKKILLLEASKEKQWIPSEKYSNRVVSINPGTYGLLNDIDAWKHIEDIRYASVKRLQVWDAISDASITFGDQASSSDVSYIVENDLLLHAVNTEAQSIENVTILYGANVKQYHLPEFHQNESEVNLENGSKYTCELLALNFTDFSSTWLESFLSVLSTPDPCRSRQIPTIQSMIDKEDYSPDMCVPYVLSAINNCWMRYLYFKRKQLETCVKQNTEIAVDLSF